jgi:hypothetical protein
MKLDQILFIVALCVLIGTAIWLYNDLNQKDFGVKETTKTIVVTSVKYDSAEKSIIVYRDRKIIDSIFVATNSPIDTIEVIRKFLTRYFVVDTLRDANLQAIIEDSIYNSTIAYRSFRYKILRPDSIIRESTTVFKHFPSFFTGIGAVITGNNSVVIPKISYFNGHKWQFEAGVGLSQKPSIFLGINYKIK